MNRTYKFVIGIGVIIAAVAAMIYSAVDQTKMYMVTVDEFIGARPSYAGRTVRIAGRVQEGTMSWNAEKRSLSFGLHDITGEGAIPVEYSGLLPDMFAEGRDVIVEGPHQDSERFEASSILTSCPSKYEPEAE